MVAISEIEDMGEESGRNEAADDFPYIPRLSTLTPEELGRYHRTLTRYGRGRAQGLYRLRGRAARKFAWSWAIGYVANCDMFEQEGHLDETEEEASNE